MGQSKVLIAGGGLGGLTAACCLIKSGFDVEVYEQASSLAEVGAGIQISANAMHALRRLSMADEIARLGVRPKGYVFRLHDTGEIVQSFELLEDHERRHGAPYVQMHRADLQHLLASELRRLRPDALRLKNRVVGFVEHEDRVEVHLEGGARVSGDVLVGADGLKSVVRKAIVGDARPVYTGDSVWRVTAPRERLPRDFLDQVTSIFMGPGGHAVCYYLRGGALMNFVGTVEAEPSEESWTLKFPWDNLKADFKGWHPAIQAIIDAADKDACYRWALYVRPPAPTWSTRRATLLGDAAHPTLPYLAQGAAMAIEDAAVLTRALLQAPSVETALDLYQRNRLPRTTRVSEQSTANQKLFHLRTQEEIRRRFEARNEGEDRNAWLYSYNPLTVELT